MIWVRWVSVDVPLPVVVLGQEEKVVVDKTNDSTVRV